MDEKKTTRASPARRRGGGIKPEEVEHRLMEIADRCMEAMPHRVYNRSTRQWEEDGSWTFDAANAIRALTEIRKYLGVDEKSEAPRELKIRFESHEDYAG